MSKTGIMIRYNKKVPCEQQLLIELAINSGDFYFMFQRENHFINKRIQKPRRVNMKYIPAVNSVNKTNRNRYNSVLKISCKIFYSQLKQLLLLTLY
jgi:hypothetical protein